MMPLKGMRDLFEPELARWRFAESHFRALALSFGFGEVRTPYLEETALFARSLGEKTAVVGKEMYSFLDRKGLSISLRPEGTAPVVRAAVEAGLLAQNPVVRLFYIGPMFRYERPQKGRQRQFHQMGIEVFGPASPAVDCEGIAFGEAYFASVGLKGRTTLLLNTIGCGTCRPAYLEKLKSALAALQEGLCADCRERSRENPLRVFDCKVESCRPHAETLPKIADAVCAPCRDHFEAVKTGLARLGIAYRLDPRLVRGLDYYTRTAFEWRAEGLGSQDAIAGGGRYDRLTSALGGPDTPALGFALGMERLAIALEAAAVSLPTSSSRVTILPLGEGAQVEALALRQKICAALSPLSPAPLPRGERGKTVAITVNLSGSGLKTQLRHANKEGANFALILGDNEIAAREVVLKNLQSGLQETHPLDPIAPLLEALAPRGPHC